MTASIPEVLAGFKSVLAPLEGVQQVYDFVPDSPNTPAIMMYAEAWPYDFSAEKTVILWCVTGTIETQGAQQMLGDWCSEGSDNSIIALIDADNRLGGIVSSVLPLTTRNFGLAPVQEGRPRLMQAQLVYNVLL